jgi:hypothetical protein
MELPVHALLSWPEKSSHLRHRDYLRLADFIRLTIAHNGRSAFAKNVLQPISTLTIRESDQETVITLDRDDRCLVRPARSPPDMAHHRSGGPFLAS